MKLTNVKVKNLKYEGRDKKVFDGHGLYLHVTQSGKYWRYKYNFAKREKKLSIGVFPDVTLKMARNHHQDARAMLRQGLCPCAEKAKHKRANEQAQQLTFEVIGREWYEYKAHRGKIMISMFVSKTYLKKTFFRLSDSQM